MALLATSIILVLTQGRLNPTSNDRALTGIPRR